MTYLVRRRDARSIYSFRAATVRNILDFPKQFSPPAYIHHARPQLLVDAADPSRRQWRDRSCKGAVPQEPLDRTRLGSEVAARHRTRRSRAARVGLNEAVTLDRGTNDGGQLRSAGAGQTSQPSENGARRSSQARPTKYSAVHGMGRQVQRSSAGSTPHDRIRILQICSSHPPHLQWPRQSASRDRPVVTNRPTTYRIRRDPPLIQRPFHHPPACWSASTPFTRLIRGTQIPIALAATPTSPSRGFLPWRFAYAGSRGTPRHRHGAAIRKPSQKRSLILLEFWPQRLTSAHRLSVSHH